VLHRDRPSDGRPARDATVVTEPSRHRRRRRRRRRRPRAAMRLDINGLCLVYGRGRGNDLTPPAPPPARRHPSDRCGTI